VTASAGHAPHPQNQNERSCQGLGGSAMAPTAFPSSLCSA
jgi:hypothetical protein